MRTRILSICFLLTATSVFIAHASKPDIAPIREPLSGIAMKIGDWQGREAPQIDPQVMAVLGVDDHVNRVYYNPKMFPASLYIGYYQSQREGNAIHSPLNCLPGAGWNPIKKSYISVPVSSNSMMEVNRIVIQKGIEKQIVLYWYQSHGRVVASEYLAKIYTVLDSLHTNRTDAALVRIVTPVAGLSTEAESYSEYQAIQFATLLFPALGRFLPS